MNRFALSGMLFAAITTSAVHEARAQSPSATGISETSASVEVADSFAEWLHWTSGRYRITPGDVIEFKFPFVPELDQTATGISIGASVPFWGWNRGEIAAAQAALDRATAERELTVGDGGAVDVHEVILHGPHLSGRGLEIGAEVLRAQLRVADLARQESLPARRAGGPEQHERRDDGPRRKRLHRQVVRRSAQSGQRESPCAACRFVAGRSETSMAR